MYEKTFVQENPKAEVRSWIRPQTDHLGKGFVLFFC